MGLAARRFKYVWTFFCRRKTPMTFRTLVVLLMLGAGTPALAFDNAADTAQVKAILAAHDRLQPAIEEYFASVAEDMELLPNRGAAVEGKAAYRRHVEQFYASGDIHIRHEVVAVDSFAEVVIVRGRAVGTFAAPGQKDVNTFQTHNLFVFKRAPDGKLEVWRIIFNDAPAKA
jgi:ketosteroid isomerase-like protein